MKKSYLLQENEFLKHKLLQSQVWMRRQVEEAKKSIQEKWLQKHVRSRLENELVKEEMDYFHKRIHDYFWDLLSFSPKRTFEHLLNAEVQWALLQKYPRMDALTLSFSYQKIFESFVEKDIVQPFRNSLWKREGHPGFIINPLDSDIVKLRNRGYHLSLGRFYQIIITNTVLPESATCVLQQFLEKDLFPLWRYFHSTSFLSRYREIIESEVFSTKRHEKKVSYSDAKMTRRLLVGNFQDRGGIFYEWLNIISQS